MEWSEDAIVLGARRHAENDVILEVMTRARGRHLGLVRGGRSRRQRPHLQPGNTLRVTWRARLDEHLGNFRAEPVTERAGLLMASGRAACGIQLAAAHLRLLAERDPHPRLYDALAVVADGLADPLLGGELLARFELLLLAELGFGLDLDRCAATGTEEALIYVSPKSGCAVSEAAGEPYRDRLLPLPAFLRSGERASTREVEEGFRLTGFFLDRHVYAPRGIPAPEARHAFLRALAQPAPLTA